MPNWADFSLTIFLYANKYTLHTAHLEAYYLPHLWANWIHSNIVQSKICHCNIRSYSKSFKKCFMCHLKLSEAVRFTFLWAKCHSSKPRRIQLLRQSTGMYKRSSRMACIIFISSTYAFILQNCYFLNLTWMAEF